jgi:hypothetical protein
MAVDVGANTIGGAPQPTPKVVAVELVPDVKLASTLNTGIGELG